MRFALSRAVKRYASSGFTSALLPDLLSATLVAVLAVPQAMAFAGIAGLPPSMGLYSAIFSPIVYALFSSSDIVVAGPTSIQSLIVLSGIASWGAKTTLEACRAASTLTMLSALIYFLLWLLRAGSIFSIAVSENVLNAFMAASAFVIGIQQLPALAQVDIPHEQSSVILVYKFLETAATGVNSVSLLIGLLCVLIFVIAKHLSGKVSNHILKQVIPGIVILLCVICSILASWRLDLQNKYDVHHVGRIAPGIPSFTLPLIDSRLGSMIIPAFFSALVGYLQSISITSVYQKKYAESLEQPLLGKHLETEQLLVSPSQELFALSLSNMAASLLFAYSVTASLTRTILNQAMGAQTSFASILAALFVLALIQALGAVFVYLPSSVLGAIVISAVLHPIVDAFSHALRFQRWKLWAEGAVWVITFLSVICLSIETGLAIGILMNLIFVAYAFSAGLSAQVHSNNARNQRVLALSGSLSYLHCTKLSQICQSEQIQVIDLRSVECFDSAIIEFMSKVEVEEILVDSNSDFPSVADAIIRDRFDIQGNLSEHSEDI